MRLSQVQNLQKEYLTASMRLGIIGDIDHLERLPD
jgi:hypothetical protein